MCTQCMTLGNTVSQYEHHLRRALREIDKQPGSRYWRNKATVAKEHADLWRGRLTEHIKTHEEES